MGRAGQHRHRDYYGLVGARLPRCSRRYRTGARGTRLHRHRSSPGEAERLRVPCRRRGPPSRLCPPAQISVRAGRALLVSWERLQQKRPLPGRRPKGPRGLRRRHVRTATCCRSPGTPHGRAARPGANRRQRSLWRRHRRLVGTARGVNPVARGCPVRVCRAGDRVLGPRLDAKGTGPPGSAGCRGSRRGPRGAQRHQRAMALIRTPFGRPKNSVARRHRGCHPQVWRHT